jgi:Flp pilus assembly pilin Flp
MWLGAASQRLADRCAQRSVESASLLPGREGFRDSLSRGSKSLGLSGAPLGEGIGYNILVALLRNESGATTLEWALLLAAVVLPSYFILQTALATVVEYYRMMTTLNALPFP